LFHGAHQWYKELTQWERVGYNVYEAAGYGIGLKYLQYQLKYVVKVDSNEH